jgi:nucleotide-binding universal stress UspA family protein
MNDAKTADTNEPRIVVGFDNTASGFDAVALARDLAEATGAHLTVAYVYPAGAITAADVQIDPGFGQYLRDQARHHLDSAGPALEGFSRWDPVAHPATTPARGLHEIADDARATLVVVGSTHRHGLGFAIPGTTAHRLLHGSAFPVIVAPAGWRESRAGGIRSIGVGFDGSRESGAALGAAATLAKATGAALRVVAVFVAPNPAHPAFAVTSHGYTEIARDLRAALQRRLDAAVETLPPGLRAESVVIDGIAADVLARESGSLDVLALGSRGYGALRGVMVGSVSSELLSRSRCPLLVVPRGADDPLFALTSEELRAATR